MRTQAAIAVERLGIARDLSGTLMPSLHRCACGGARTLTGSCAACEQKRLLGKPLQAKLRVSEQGDQYEQEADRVAAQVMRMSEVEVNGPRRDTGTPVVQRRATTGGTGVMEAPPIVHDVLNSPGQPLDAATRAFFEPRFGHDFGHVRVHSDAAASESARAVNALAYTVGRDIVFRTGRFDPHSQAGRHLLTHELSHVVQALGTAGRRQTLQKKAAISSSDKASLEQGKSKQEAQPMPPVDCTVEITPTHNCFALIGEMIAIQADMRENNQWLERYRNGDIPWDADAYKARAKDHGEFRAKFQAKERVRAVCCPNNQVPGEAPTATPSPVPTPQPAPSSPSNGDQ